MKKILFLFFAFTAMLGFSGTNDLDVARAALRDGLWNVARAHARKADGDTAKLIVLETYAREGNWKGLLAAYDAMGYPTGEGFSYYRAAALFKDGSAATASNVLAGVTGKDAAFASPTARLRAELALSAGDGKGALAILEKSGGNDVETKLMLASLHGRKGDRKAAAALWRSVASDTNASERARAAAAAELNDVPLMRELLKSVQSAELRRFVSLKLGIALMADAATFAEGEKMIRETVRDKPDADGAYEAFLALADAWINRGEYAKAEETYSDALQIWPDAANSAPLHEGRGWALLKLGRTQDALGEFRQAEELGVDPERKAVAAVKIADALAAAGREKDSDAAYRHVCRDYSNTVAAARAANEIGLRDKEKTGRELYRAFRFDEARKVFEELAKADPSRREQLAFYCVLCSYGSGNDEQAETLARTLATSAEDATVRAEAMRWLAKFAFNRSRWQESKELFAAFAETLPASPDAPQALVWSARAALAESDFQSVISNVVKLVSRYPESPARAAGMLAQGEALVELGRFDEAVLVLDRATLVKGASDAERLDARIRRADALFAMGADNPARYQNALDAYAAIRTGEALTPDAELSLAFKSAKTLEKMKRLDEATDAYYTQVVLAYRTGRLAGTRYGEAAQATFARAAFRLADEYESRGRIRQAIHVLDLVRTSDVSAAGEAASRIDKLIGKGISP